MGYMHYVNLGYYAPDGTPFQPGWSPAPNVNFIDGNGIKSSFLNLQANEPYWSETEYAIYPEDAVWKFSFRTGIQGLGSSKSLNFDYVWAVRDGDVPDTRPVPKPTTMLLLGSGLLGLVGLRRKFRK